MERENSLIMNYVLCSFGNPKHKIQFSDNFLMLQYCCFIVSVPIIWYFVASLILFGRIYLRVNKYLSINIPLFTFPYSKSKKRFSRGVFSWKP